MVNGKKIFITYWIVKTKHTYYHLVTNCDEVSVIEESRRVT